MTLDKMIDDVLLEARNNHIAESEHLSRRQIQLWIQAYRAYLIKQDIDKERIINPTYTQTMRIHLSKVEPSIGHYIYESDEELPPLIGFHQMPGIVSVKDAYGNLIQLGSETKMNFQKYRKYACNDYIAYVKDNKIYTQNKDNALEYLDVAVIAEDPTDLKMCYNPSEDEYPLPIAMWPTVKSLIFTKDIPMMLNMPVDVTNDSADQTVNAGTKQQKE